MDIAVVVVTWNTRQLALDTLRSLFADLASSGLQAEVYLVDSASSDGTAEAVAAAFPQVKLTASQENLGFGKANNLAIQQIMSRADAPNAIYLLNPDTVTQPGATRALYDALMASPRVGLVGARLSYGDGSFQHGAFGFPGLRQLWVEFFPTPGRLIEGRFNGRYPRALYDAGQPFPVDFTLGATMMLKREAVEQTKGFDEQFFMYCEEIDWAWRIHRAGWDVLCVPAAHVVHLGGQSTAQVRPQSLINLWTSRLLLYRKHHPAWKFTLARLITAAGMWQKMRHESQPTLREAYQTIYRMALNP
ncbi:MAG: glycosyltransferase family 2 protein [Anaerolineae bacterium]